MEVPSESGQKDQKYGETKNNVRGRRKKKSCSVTYGREKKGGVFTKKGEGWGGKKGTKSPKHKGKKRGFF